MNLRSLGYYWQHLLWINTSFRNRKIKGEMYYGLDMSWFTGTSLPKSPDRSIKTGEIKRRVTYESIAFLFYIIVGNEKKINCFIMN